MKLNSKLFRSSSICDKTINEKPGIDYSSILFPSSPFDGTIYLAFCFSTFSLPNITCFKSYRFGWIAKFEYLFSIIQNLPSLFCNILLYYHIIFCARLFTCPWFLLYCYHLRDYKSLIVYNLTAFSKAPKICTITLLHRIVYFD